MKLRGFHMLKTALRQGHGRRPWLRLVASWLVVLAGAGLALSGAYLLALGGSPYYLLAGLVTAAAGYLLLKNRASGYFLFALVVLATIAWSLWEVGFDGWALMPRLAFFLVAFLVLSLPGVRSGLVRPSERAAGLLRAATFVFTALLAISILLAFGKQPNQLLSVAGSLPSAQVSSARANREWTAYGGTSHGTRYSPVAQINTSNVSHLSLAWTYRPGMSLPGGTRKGGLQVTPLYVGGRVYGCTAMGSIFALDPVTGKQIWRYNPTIDNEQGGHPVCRGLTFYRAPEGTQDCPERLLLGNFANQLMAVDARTGKLCKSFGLAGIVDLGANMGDFPDKWTHPTSPPALVNDTVVIGGYVVDNQATDVPPGAVRGYSALTGELEWAFDPGRPNNRSLPNPGETFTPSTPNSWSVASADPELNTVYLPMGNGAPDFYGPHRTPETDRFTSALVALDASTGAVRWTFQAVHHDLWDYDLAAQPVLTDFPTSSGSVPAVIVPTKTGQIFVLDRRTGKPLTKVEERPVPRSTIPGERASPTQPFSTGMPDFAGPTLRESDMWGITPFDQLYCRIKFRQADYEGIFTPPRLGPSIRYPGELGGIDWGSVSVDEGREILVVNSNHMADYDTLVTRAEADRRGIKARSDASVHSAPGAAMRGTPYAVVWGPFLSGLEVPCQRPPYGFLTAIDLKSRKILWRKPLGDSRRSGPFGFGLGLPITLGAPNIGGTLTTGGGLVFVAATQDDMMRAFDVQNGKQLWQTQLPVSGHATPMTYLGPEGNQYVVIAAGGGSLRNRSGDYIMAFRLDRDE